jgi:hypothetical protein
VVPIIWSSCKNVLAGLFKKNLTQAQSYHVNPTVQQLNIWTVEIDLSL